MDSIVVTLRHDQKEIDLEMPVSVPLFVLAPILIDKLGWTAPAPGDDSMLFTGRVINSGLIIRPHETLGQAGVVDGDILELTLTRHISHKELPTGQATGTHLQCVESGRTFPCRGRTSLIGRWPHHPISLNDLPGSDAVSRTHANLLYRRDGYWLKDEHSTNGTIVDGYMLKPAESVRLRDGCQIQFGVDGPVLIFHSGQDSAA